MVDCLEIAVTYRSSAYELAKSESYVQFLERHALTVCAMARVKGCCVAISADKLDPHDASTVGAIAQHGARKLHELTYAWKADVGKEPTKARNIGEYLEFLWRWMFFGWGDEVEDVKIYLVRYYRQDSVD